MSFFVCHVTQLLKKIEVHYSMEILFEFSPHAVLKKTNLE